MKPIAIFALMSFLAFPVLAHARAERVPKLDVAGSCREAKGFGTTDPGQTYKNCMLAETQAKRQLEKNWAHFKPSTRRDCRAAGAYPSPSYVELLTCIEMTEQTLIPQSTESGGMGGGMGGGGALGSPPPRPSLAPGPRAMPR
ncbi:hypothetical protein [Methylovirgula sp. HY1]|jgi:hypothetical protein|uniref:hypothetical protein n=1 Tax=Methylovirgula sp. HY1 TaxID=2822761 RepID=UPI001C5B7ECE|nr:hypothetical protein [Methylovirgula sp. HY1]QXX75248.1 hypothetical protein MHY1_02067 [Methylovirgula sp. HY1]